MKMESNPRLGKIKDEIWKLLGESPVAPRKLQTLASRFEGSLKGLVSPGMLFEDFGFQYFGPFDGHNVRELIEIFQNVKTAHRHPTLIHVLTQKGKGYECAELDPVKYHGVKAAPAAPPADKIEPKIPEKAVPATMAYMDIFGEAMIQETARDRRVVAITAAMKEGTGLVKYSETHPDHFFDVGIAEGHAVTFAAGLAVAGMRPVAAIYSTFLQRAFDHIVHDCAIQHLPVLFCLDRGGLVGEDGPTHHGCLDLTYLSSIQEMVVAAPRSGQELRNLIRTGLLYDKGPFAVRYPRDKAPDVINWDEDPSPVPVGTWEILREGRNLAILAVGTMVEAARRAIAKEELNVTLVNCRFVKPMDVVLLEQILDSHEALIALEEGTGVGGFASHVALFMLERGYDHPFKALYLPDNFVEHGSRDKLLELCGLSDRHIAEAICAMLDRDPAAIKASRTSTAELLKRKTQVL